MHEHNILRAGKELSASGNVLILLHGRGGSAEDILSLSSSLHVEEFSLLAPQATRNTWYPFSFLSPVTQNEPWLSYALELLFELVKEINDKGVPTEHIYLAGFSQGACLALEFTARRAMKYGGVAAFTGGLIGDRILRDNYKGDFQRTPVFIGTSDPDPHVPVERVQASASVFRELNAVVTEKIYTNMGHTISQDEIDQVNKLIFRRNV